MGDGKQGREGRREREKEKGREKGGVGGVLCVEAVTA